MRLARFIGVTAKPQNEHAAPISMTAPVLMSPGNDASSSSSYKMAFFLPASRFSRAADAPKPTDPSVRLVDIPARTVAAHTFSGTMRAAVIAEKDRELRDALQTAGVKVKPGAEAMAGGVQSPLDARVSQDERGPPGSGGVSGGRHPRPSLRDY